MIFGVGNGYRACRKDERCDEPPRIGLLENSWSRSSNKGFHSRTESDVGKGVRYLATRFAVKPVQGNEGDRFSMRR